MNRSPVTILLVEDNHDHAELIVRGLRDHRLPNTIHHVTNGEAALDYLFCRGAYSDPELCPRPDLILLDVKLPRIGGFDVLRECKASADLRGIPVVIVTASGAERDVARAYHNHANSYVVKPLDLDAFTRLLDHLGSFWMGWHEGSVPQPAAD